MGSHYIPVGKIKFDKELLDIVCPAVGYTPELICTLENGYIPNPNVHVPWVAPFDTGVPNAQEIILLCTNKPPSIIYFRVQGNYTVEVFDSLNNLIQTSDHASGAYYTYQFPTVNENALYILKIKNRAGSTITLFRCHDITNSGYNSDWQILEAKFNTPNITTLANAFQYIQTIKKISFYSSLDSLTSMASFLSDSGIESFTFPASLPACTSLSSFFERSTIKIIDLNGCNLPQLTSIASFVKNCSYLFSLVFNPTNTKKLSLLVGAFSYLQSLKEISVDCTLGEETTSAINADTLFEYSNFEKITSFIGHPDATSLLSCKNMFRGLPYLKEITLRGKTIFENDSIISSCPSLEKVTYGEISNMSNYTLWTQNPPSRLKTINLPLQITGIISTMVSPLYFTYLEEFNNQPVNDTELNMLCANGVRYLKRFDQPNLKMTRLALGAAGGALEYVEVDWANSSFEFGAAGTTVIVLKGNLSTSELNRIFTALPPQTKTIDVGSNPGYAACNKAIAEAKGWTVL